VLTARHCVHQADYSQATGFCDGHFTDIPLTDAPVRVTTDISVKGANVSWLDVAEILVSPASDTTCGGDIVLLRLEDRIPWRVAHPALLDLSDLTQNKPKAVAVVGRGSIAQTFDTTTYEIISDDDGGLKRRVKRNIPFVCVSDTMGDCVAADIGQPFEVDPYYAQIGQGPLSGDSGAGFFRQAWFDHKVPVMFAVMSAGTVDPNTGIPNFGFGVRLDKHADFIHNALLSRGVSSFNE
jgi:hypothetical protein